MDENFLKKESLKSLVGAVGEGHLSVSDLTSYFLNRIDEFQPYLNSFIKWDSAVARESVRRDVLAVEQRLKAGETLPLAGIPVAVKDNICTKDWDTTAGSKMLENFRATYDATVISKLKKAGAIVVGKLNMDEFAMGSSSETSYFGSVKNPWNSKYVSGGSSGGSAAAVASGMIPFSLGSDTGGSVRQPASLCGVVGFKPTYGLVSRYGLLAYGSSLDQIGPITRHVEDAHLVHKIISGHDPLDSTSLESPSLGPLTAGLTGKKIGRVKEFESENISSEVSAAYERALDLLAHSGAEIVDVSLPSLPYVVATYYILVCAEASSNLSRYDGIRYGLRSQEYGESLTDLYLSTRSSGFGKEVKKRIILGTYVLSAGYKDAYYEKALYAREMLKNEYREVFKQADLLVSPTSPTPAFLLGAKLDSSLSMYLSDIFTLLHNLVSAPALSIPCGFSKNGLPLGLQFSALPFDEEKLFNGALSYEQQAGISFNSPK